MPLVLLILRLLTGIGALLRLGAAGTKWARRRGKVVGPVVKPRFDWTLDEHDPPPRLRFRIKNDGHKSAIIDELAFSMRPKGGPAQSMPLPDGFDAAYPIQVKPDESSAWFELPLAPAQVELLRERERLAKLRARPAGTAGDEGEYVDERSGTDSNDQGNDPIQSRASGGLSSGVELLVVHEHGRQSFPVPGPWQRPPAAPARSGVGADDDTVATELEAATMVLDDEVDIDADGLGHA